ncbi:MULTISPECIES: DNA/RNA nuclease SfsA [Caulobacter]|jgi:sugar fermentation stimulation protein A|uniref:Sugar fermentation stimulation protein homolog n=1 Tax=Caulobacter vibrioides OR37 TaxID=1292034 RepID=R0EDW2_CAUVI|nr:MULTISPECIES: DNA/RNA nuclease SfsA [Caulobacter]ENZ79537.1 sugar fermentation stimulation protein [Caulobacter vibrioides OR37]MBQ1561482.1 DNA/RNA nuclease SfsA [Caulobacter sp.]
MKLPQPLIHGRLVSRYKRFFADLVLDDGREITAHCPNPGAMLGVKAPGQGAWVSWSDDPKRKLAYTLQMVEQGDALVGINTLLPNRLVAEALAEDLIPELSGYATIRPEVKFAEASRVDFLLTHPDRPPCWLEVKNCHFSRTPGLAEFPDCKAERSTRHLGDLAAQVAHGDRAVVLFVVQREDCDAFQACADLDPAFARGLDAAAKAGVEVLVYDCAMGMETVRVARRIAWRGSVAGN